MKFLLCLCIVSSVIATFDPAECLKAFTNFKVDVLDLKQKDLTGVCASDELVGDKIKITKNVIVKCGLKDWQSSNNANDRRLGAVVRGLLGFIERLLCLKKKDTYCFPAAAHIVDIPYLLNVFSNYDADNLELDLIKCSVMSNKKMIRAICPGGSINSGKRQCQQSMVEYFEMAVRMAQALLKGAGSNNVIEEVMPLLDLALDIKNICREGGRKKVMKLAKRMCVGSEPTDEPDFPSCLTDQTISAQCLRDEICEIKDDPVCNRIEENTLSVLAANRNYKGLLTPKFALRDGSELTFERAENICCDKACREEKEKGKICGAIKQHTTDIEIMIPNRDLGEELKGLDSDGINKLKEACCKDQQAKRGSFDIKDCQVEFKDGSKKELSRRLLAETTSVIASVTVNSSDGTPFDCENRGSFYSFDTVLNNEVSTTHANDTVSHQSACNCSETTTSSGTEESSCVAIDTDEWSSDETMSSSAEWTSTESDESSAMKFSISLAAVLFCVLFAIN